MEKRYLTSTAYMPLLLADPDYVDTLMAQVLEKVLPLADAASGQELLLVIDVGGVWGPELLAYPLVELPATGGIELLAQYYRAGELRFETISPHPEGFEIAAFTTRSNCCCVRIVLHPHLQCIKVILS